MSVTQITYIHCDGCDEPSDNSPIVPSTAKELRREAKERGDWHVGLPGGVDFCPDCWSEREG